MNGWCNHYVVQPDRSYWVHSVALPYIPGLSVEVFNWLLAALKYGDCWPLSSMLLAALR